MGGLMITDKSVDDASLINIKTYDFSKLYVYGDDVYCNQNTKSGGIFYKYKYKSAVVGGLYNTGTNALLSLLRQNCFGLSPRFIDKGSRKMYRKIRTEISKNVEYFEGFNYNSLYNITKHEAIPSM